MSTASVDAIYQLLRTRLLTYVDPGGKTLQQDIGARLWRLAPPDNLKASDYPFAIFDLKSPTMPVGTDRIKISWELEVMFFARPVGSHAAIEALGDRALSALLTYRDTSDGILWVEGGTVESLPTPISPADPDVQQMRVLATVTCYPSLLTRLST